MNLKKYSLNDLACLGLLREGNGCYKIMDKRIDIIYTDSGDKYCYEHSNIWYDTLRKAINDYDKN